MNITVFGASGAVGKHFIDLAIKHGHAIRAVYRTIPHISASGQVKIRDQSRYLQLRLRHSGHPRGKRGNHHPGSQLRQAPQRSDHNDLAPDLHQRLARTLVRVTRDSGASPRVISVSTGSIRNRRRRHGPGPRMLFGFFRTFVVRNLRLVGRDLGAMEKELAESGLDWYAVRPIKLTDGPLTERVQASDSFAMKSISRADVAWYLLTLAENPSQQASANADPHFRERRNPAQQSGKTVVVGRVA